MCKPNANRVRKRAVTLLLLLAMLPTAGAAVIADAPEMRDPLQPPNLRQPAEQRIDPDRWKLTSTLVSDDRWVAIINGRVVGPGQTVDGARVLAVERSSVRLRVNDHTFTIRSAIPSVRSEPRRQETQ